MWNRPETKPLLHNIPLLFFKICISLACFQRKSKFVRRWTNFVLDRKCNRIWFLVSMTDFIFLTPKKTDCPLVRLGPYCSNHNTFVLYVQKIIIIYNYPPKRRWIVVDRYRDAKRRGIYPPLFTDPEGDSCFSIYQIRWIKKFRFNFFFWNFRETTRHFSCRSQNSE